MTYTFNEQICVIGAPNGCNKFEGFRHEWLDENYLKRHGIYPSEINGFVRIVRLFNEENSKVYWVVLGMEQSLQFAFQEKRNNGEIIISNPYSPFDKAAICNIKSKLVRISIA